uniref:Ig-like domain-containing protein n=1 Tax=Crocodylus porosus TaxID=8502 RepID=A0A7M4FS37_CROPO
MSLHRGWDQAGKCARSAAASNPSTDPTDQIWHADQPHTTIQSGEVFANKEKVQTEVKAALKESATLSCEVAQAETEVKWYKDGKLVTASKKFKIQSEGKSRRLVVQEVEKKDAGEYTCEAAGQKLTFKVMVTALIQCFKA